MSKKENVTGLERNVTKAPCPSPAHTIPGVGRSSLEAQAAKMGESVVHSPHVSFHPCGQIWMPRTIHVTANVGQPAPKRRLSLSSLSPLLIHHNHCVLNYLFTRSNPHLTSFISPATFQSTLRFPYDDLVIASSTLT
jgi:hypothetical protein